MAAAARITRARDIRGRVALLNYGEVPEVWHQAIIVSQLVSSATKLCI